MNLRQKYTIIGSVSAGQSNVQYTISDGNKDGIFAVNSHTGVLSVADPVQIDYEKRKVYKLVVHGNYNSYLILEAKVTLHVLDANDNSPVISKNRYIVRIKEDVKIGSTILNVVASDKDSGNNSRISYVLANEQRVPFDVSFDGAVKITNSLDPVSKYFLYIKAIDWGHPNRCETEVIVEVFILSVNSHSPVMKQSYCDITLNPTLLAFELMTFIAIDEDIDNEISYEFQQNNKLFSLNSSSGILSLTEKHIEESREAIVLYIIASDGTHKSKPTQVNILFKVSMQRSHCNSSKEYERVNNVITKRKMIKEMVEKQKTF